MTVGDHVTLRGPSLATDGEVLAIAPYSILIGYQQDGAKCEHWFAWEPGRPMHLKHHGVAGEFAVWIEGET